jgi:hypothetical protein
MFGDAVEILDAKPLLKTQDPVGKNDIQRNSFLCKAVELAE